MLWGHGLMRHHRVEQPVADDLRGTVDVIEEAGAHLLQPERAPIWVIRIGEAVGIKQERAAPGKSNTLLV